jgi:hypothetical protein
LVAVSLEYPLVGVAKASRGVQAAVLDPGLAVAVDDLSALKVLSYTGMLTIAMIIDRGHGLDLDK